MTATVAPVALEDTELGGILADLTAWSNTHPGVQLICAGIRAIADDQHLTAEGTAVLLASLVNNSGQPDVLSAITHLIGRLTSDANPAVRALPDDRAKDAQAAGETAVFYLADPDPAAADAVAESCAALTGCD